MYNETIEHLPLEREYMMSESTFATIFTVGLSILAGILIRNIILRMKQNKHNRDNN